MKYAINFEMKDMSSKTRDMVVQKCCNCYQIVTNCSKLLSVVSY